MTDIPIIFSAPMVLALLAGRKTMTRRLAWRETPNPWKAGDYITRKASSWQRVQPGDRLWVRENFHPWKGSASGKTICYVADDRWIDWGSGQRWKDKVEWLTPITPSIHMPRWASRLTLVVTAAKIGRLQEISGDDAIAEGIHLVQSGTWETGGFGRWSSPRFAFENLWNELHGAGAWDANPEVVALTFTIHQQNIDSMEKAA